MSDVFVSYSRKDRVFVSRLEEALHACGKQPWVDTQDILPAREWREEIELALQGSDGFVFVISPDSLDSFECAKELRRAGELRKRIVPVVHREPTSAVPTPLAERNWVYLRRDDDFEAGVGKVVEALDADVDWVRTHTRLGARAAEWEAHSRNGAYLIRGDDLTDAEAFLTGAAGKEPEPSAAQLEYVAAARSAARRRQRRLLSAVSIALVFMGVLAILAVLERNSAVSSQHRAYSRQLAADAQTQLGIDPELSVLLASKSLAISPTAESVTVLRQALVTSKLRMAVRPREAVAQAAMIPDGRMLVVVGRDHGTVSLWSYPRGVLLGRLPSVSAASGQMSIDPRGRILLVDRSMRGAARVFSRTSLLFSMGSSVTTAAWADGGRLIFTGDQSGIVSEWNGETGAAIAASRAGARPIVAVAMSANGRYLAAERATGETTLYDLRRGSAHVLPPPAADVSLCGRSQRLLFDPDSSRLLIYSRCDEELWNTATGRPVRKLGLDGVNSAAFSSDGFQLAVAGATVVIVNPQTGRLGGQYLGHLGVVNALAFSPAGSRLGDVVSGGVDGTIQFWNPDNPTHTDGTLRANGGPVGAVAYAPGGSAVISVDGDGGAARVWATPSAEPAAVSSAPASGSYPPDPGGPALSSDGQLSIAGDLHDGLRVLHSRSGAVLVRLKGSAGRVPQVSPHSFTGFLDGPRLAYGAAGDAVRFWRVGDGSLVREIVKPGYAVADVHPAEDAPRAAVLWTSGNATSLELIDLRSGHRADVAVGSPPAINVSPDGSLCAVALRRRILLLDAASGRMKRAISFPSSGLGKFLEFSGDGHRLLVAGTHSVKTFAVSTGAPVGPGFTVSGANITSVAISISGRLSAAGATDFRARVWDSQTGQLLTSVQEPKQLNDVQSLGITAVRISKNEQFLLTSVYPNDTFIWEIANGNQLLYVEDVYAGWGPDPRLLHGVSGATWLCDACGDIPQLRRLAEQRVTRDFTAGERAKYLTQ